MFAHFDRMISQIVAVASPQGPQFVGYQIYGFVQSPQKQSNSEILGWIFFGNCGIGMGQSYCYHRGTKTCTNPTILLGKVHYSWLPNGKHQFAQLGPSPGKDANVSACVEAFLPSSAFAPGAKLDRLCVGRGFVSWLSNCGCCSADFFMKILRIWEKQWWTKALPISTGKSQAMMYIWLYLTTYLAVSRNGLYKRHQFGGSRHSCNCDVHPAKPIVLWRCDTHSAISTCIFPWRVYIKIHLI